MEPEDQIPYKKDDINSLLSQIKHTFTEEDEKDFNVRGEEIKKILRDEIGRNGWQSLLCFKESYTQEADLDKVAKYRLQQIRLLGSIKMYDKVENDFQDCVENINYCRQDDFHKMHFDPLLANQYFDLYKWREDFFHKHFPVGTWKLADKSMDDVVPWHMMGHEFSRLLAIACCNREASSDGDYIDISDAPKESPDIQLMYSKQVFKRMIEVDKEIYLNMNKDNVLHMLAAIYPKQPRTLQYYAAKVYWANDIPLDRLSKQLQKETKRILSKKIITKKNIEDYLSSEGNEIFMKGVAKYYYRMWRKKNDGE